MVGAPKMCEALFHSRGSFRPIVEPWASPAPARRGEGLARPSRAARLNVTSLGGKLFPVEKSRLASKIRLEAED